jgi:hypothetical protein
MSPQNFLTLFIYFKLKGDVRCPMPVIVLAYERSKTVFYE